MKTPLLFLIVVLAVANAAQIFSARNWEKIAHDANAAGFAALEVSKVAIEQRDEALFIAKVALAQRDACRGNFAAD